MQTAGTKINTSIEPDQPAVLPSLIMLPDSDLLKNNNGQFQKWKADYFI